MFQKPLNWEVPLLLGFLLLFSAWITFPLTGNYFFIDSHGVKHHVLTPAVSNHDAANNLTNLLFTKYEDPWMDYTGINIIFVAGIFIILPQEPIRLCLTNRVWASVRVNLEKCLHGILQNRSKDLDIEYGKGNNDHAIWQSLIFFTPKKLIKSSKVFFIFFSILILLSFYSQNAYAAIANFVDGNQFTGLSTNCNARSTVATLSTSLPAASSSNPNIIIATTDYVSSDSQIEMVDLTSGLYRSTTLLSQSQYNLFIAKKDQGTHYTYLFEDTTASANPTYTIQACLSATAGNAESKILAVQGLESSFIDGGNVGTTAGSFVTIETLTTDLTASDHVIIAQVQIDFDGTPTIALGDIELRNSADMMLSENQFELRGASGTFGDGATITLVAIVPGASANTSYKVAVREPVGGGVIGAEAKILGLKANGGQEYFSDGGSVSVGASSTQLTSLTSGFSNNQKIVVLSSSQFDDTNGAVEKLDATTGHEIRENSVAKSGNQMEISERTGAGQAGEGLRHTLIWYGTVGGPSLGYDSRADASSTGYSGESKLLAFSIHQDLFPIDTPVLSDSAIVQLKGAILGTDTPTLTDNALVNQKLFPIDSPVLSDNATIQLTSSASGTDTPILTESVLIHQNLFPSDTLTANDSSTIQLTATDAPTLTDNALVNQNLFPNDTPVLADGATIQLSGTRSGTDTPSLSDSATIQLSVVAGTDTPSITDSASILKFKKRGSSGDMEPPSFTGRLSSSGEFGGIINANNLNLPLHSETVSTTIIKTGEETQLKLLIYDNSGLSAIQHVAVYTNLRETKRDIENSDTYIVYEKGNVPLQITDPNGFFSNVGLKISPKDKDLELTFYITFAKLMDKSDIIFRLWDVYRNSQDIKILDAIQVIESSNNEIAGVLNNTASDNTSPIDLIKTWGGDSSSPISDTNLLKYFGIEADYVPSWFKKNYPRWIISEQVSLQEFIDAIEYMYEKRIIH